MLICRNAEGVHGQKKFVNPWFKCYISDKKKEPLKQYNTVMSVILSGCTKYLLPLDVSINKLLK